MTKHSPMLKTPRIIEFRCGSFPILTKKKPIVVLYHEYPATTVFAPAREKAPRSINAIFAPYRKTFLIRDLLGPQYKFSRVIYSLLIWRQQTILYLTSQSTNVS